MKIKYLYLFVFLFFANVQNIISEQIENINYSSLGHFQFSYWNDNFLFENMLSEIISKGKDDHVTASFSLEYFNWQQCNGKIYKINFDILTNKTNNYRADLLTLLWLKIRKLSIGMVEAGIGFAIRSNLGGITLQNGYHNLWGYPKVDLPYIEKTKMGIMFQSGIQYNFLEKSNFKILGEMEGNYITSASPSKLFSSLQLEYKTFLSFQIEIGYVYYYHTDKWLTPLFNNDFTWKFLASKEFNKLFDLDFWLIQGQYGIGDEFHFGLAFRIYFNKYIDNKN